LVEWWLVFDEEDNVNVLENDIVLDWEYCSLMEYCSLIYLLVIVW